MPKVGTINVKGGHLAMTLVGDKQLLRDFKRLQTNTQRKMVRQSMRPALKIVHKEAVATTPKRSGKLKQSVKLRSIKRSRVRFGVQVRTNAGFFQGETFYGGFVHYGTQRGITAQPWIARAFDRNVHNVINAYQERLKRLVWHLPRGR